MDDLARHVGADVFRRACEHAVATAAGTGRSLAPDPESDTDVTMVPHHLSDYVEGDLDLAIALYRVMPCFGNLMYLAHWVPTSELFREFRALLDEPDSSLADPVSYWLWCGPFEGDEAESAAAWEGMCVDLTERRLGRLLDVSGPVPWSAKGPVLESLVTDRRWHRAIWRAVRDAVVDIYGRVDAAAADRLLSQMGDPPAGIAAIELRRQLRGLK